MVSAGVALFCGAASAIEQVATVARSVSVSVFFILCSLGVSGCALCPCAALTGKTWQRAGWKDDARAGRKYG